MRVEGIPAYGRLTLNSISYFQRDFCFPFHSTTVSCTSVNSFKRISIKMLCFAFVSHIEATLPVISHLPNLLTMLGIGYKAKAADRNQRSN